MLKEKKLVTGIGISWSSLVRECSLKRLGTSRATLNNGIQGGRWINGVCVAWGKGLVLLLAPNFTTAYDVPPLPLIVLNADVLNSTRDFPSDQKDGNAEGSQRKTTC